MASKKIIAVVGATGAQGGGLCRAILADASGEFTVRALTRDPASPAAKALAALGAEVVRADVDDEASLVRGFEGAHGAFCVSFFWAHFSAEREIAEIERMARAAKRAGIAHAVCSTLEDTRRLLPIDDPRMPVLQGKYNVPHFDAKGEANRFFTEPGVPTTFLQTSFYWDNFIHFGLGPKKGPDGVYAITLPMGTARLPGIAAADIGGVALGIFKRGAAAIGQTISIAGECLTGAEMAAGLGKALGFEVRYHAVDPDAYRGFGFPGADEMGNMFQWKRDFEAEYCAPRDPKIARALHPGLQTFAAWLEANASRIPLS
jgi:uncharacterized protein YbjT (DUF2867 family)